MTEEVKKRARSKYFAITSKGKIIRAKSEAQLQDQLSTLTTKDILFTCKGFELKPLQENKIKLVRTS